MSWPTDPTIGDEYTVDGKTWVYMGNETWERKDITLGNGITDTIPATATLTVVDGIITGYTE